MLYVISDEDSINRVKQLYKDLDLASAYHIHAEESYNLIKSHAQQTKYDITGVLDIMNKLCRLKIA